VTDRRRDDAPRRHGSRCERSRRLVDHPGAHPVGRIDDDRSVASIERDARRVDAGSARCARGRFVRCTVASIDLEKMKSGSGDPSFAPFWIPGQSLHAQYVSPQWTKALLTPPM
jgi:hypothetical protein